MQDSPKRKNLFFPPWLTLFFEGNERARSPFPNNGRTRIPLFPLALVCTRPVISRDWTICISQGLFFLLNSLSPGWQVCWQDFFSNSGGCLGIWSLMKHISGETGDLFRATRKKIKFRNICGTYCQWFLRKHYFFSSRFWIKIRWVKLWSIVLHQVWFPSLYSTPRPPFIYPACDTDRSASHSIDRIFRQPAADSSMNGFHFREEREVL